MPIATEDRVAVHLAVLQSSVAELVTGEQWQRYLSVQARFHSYRTGGVGLFEARECWPVVWRYALGDGGGVCGPVAAGGGGPSGGGASVDADDGAEHGGGDLGGESGPGVVAHVAGFDADGAEPFGERFSADVSAGMGAGQQPWAGELVGDAVAAPHGQLFDEGDERLVDGQGVPAEGEGGGAVVVAVEVAGGEGDDSAQRLAVEDDESAGDAVVGTDGVVGDEASGEHPTSVGVDDGAQDAGLGGGQVDVAEVVAP
jgi:hypothetical protein